MQIASAEGRRARRERCATEVVPLMERAFGVPLGQVHADRVPAPPWRVAAVA
jgi:hypothetical protein